MSEATASQEPILYDTAGFKLTPKQVTVGPSVYALSSVSGARLANVASMKGLGFIIILTGLGIAAASIGVKGAGVIIAMVALGLAIAALGAFLIYRAKPLYGVYLTINGRETPVYRTLDQQAAQAIVNAVGEALSRRA